MMLSIVAPCFDEEAVLSVFWQRVVTAVRECAVEDHEIILVDDGSRDGTWGVIDRLCASDPHVVGLRLSRNFGHQLALTAGLGQAQGERILIIDADLQDPPELLSQMMRLMDDGADVVYGQRRHRRGESAFKLGTSYVFYRVLSWLSDIEIPRDTGDFRLINRRVLAVFNSMPEHERFIRGMISSIGFNQRPLLYDREERAAGHSKYPLGKMIRFAGNAVASFSTKPLRLASYLGLGVAALCCLAILYQIVAYFVGTPVPGWTSLIVVILFVGSLQLFVLGIIGGYLGRLFVECKRRPLYIVAEVIGRSTAPSTAER